MIMSRLVCRSRVRKLTDQMSLILLFYSNGRANSCTEFHRHKIADNPVHVMGFLLEWKRYLDKIESQSSKDGPFRGERMDATVFEKVWGFQIVVSCIRPCLHDLDPYSEREWKLICHIHR
jgi:hypothetical protein